jgi:hypothetical protein
MGWEQVDFTNLDTSPQPIPTGEYTVAIQGAAYNDRDPNRIDVTGVILEGDSAGRKLFFNYPDPQVPKTAWSQKAFKILLSSLGAESLPGEDAVELLNRTVQTGDGRVSLSVVTGRTYTNQAGVEKTATDVQLYSVRPA